MDIDVLICRRVPAVSGAVPDGLLDLPLSVTARTPRPSRPAFAPAAAERAGGRAARAH